MFGGQLLGMSVGTSGGGYALNQMGLSGVALHGTGGTLAIFLVPLLVRERVGERLLPWSSGQASQHALDLQVDRLLPLMKSGFVALAYAGGSFVYAGLQVTFSATGLFEVFRSALKS